MRDLRIQPKVLAMQALGLVWGNLDTVAANLEEVRTRIDIPSQYGARLLLDFWRAKQSDGGFVVGRDVPSRRLASILRNLAIYEPLEDGGDFRVRLAGTALMRRFGRDVTGLRLSEIYDASTFPAQRNNLGQVVATGEPFVFDVQVARDERLFLRFEAVRLAVLSPDRRSSWALGSIFYSDWA